VSARRRTAVIGAGPAGCAAAYELARAGRSVVVIEQARFVGGRTRTYRHDGVVIDSGAALATSFDTTTLGYARAVGLDRDLVRANYRVGLVDDRRKVILSPGTASGLLKFPACSWREKLRLLWFVCKLVLKRRRFDLSEPATLAELDSMSVAERARSELGETLYQVFVRPSIETFWYVSCEELSQSLMLALYARGPGAKLLRFRSGMDGLCQALLRDIPVRLGTAVTDVVVRGDDTLVVRLRGDEQLEVDELVIATPASVARNLVAALPASIVGASQRAFLDSQRYVANIHGLFWIDSDVRRVEHAVAPMGWANDPPVVTIAFDPMAVVPPRAGRYVSVYLSAGKSAELVGLGRADIAEQCWALARTLEPVLPRKAHLIELFDRDEAIPVLGVGRFKLATAFQEAQKPPVVLAGDYLAAASVDGALRSGKLAATRLIAPQR